MWGCYCFPSFFLNIVPDSTCITSCILIPFSNPCCCSRVASPCKPITTPSHFWRSSSGSFSVRYCRILEWWPRNWKNFCHTRTNDIFQLEFISFAAQGSVKVPQTDRVAAVLLLELSSVMELHLWLQGEPFRAQSEQLLQAADQALIKPLQLHGLPHLVRSSLNITKSTVQLTLHIEEAQNVKIKT